MAHSQPGRMTERKQLDYSAAMDGVRPEPSGTVSPRPPGAATAASDPGARAVAAWQPFRGPFQRWPRLMDTLLACLALSLTLVMWSGGDEPDAPASAAAGLALALALIGNFALVRRRRYPVHVHAVVLAASALVLLVTPHEGIFAMPFSLYSLGRYADNDRMSIGGMFAALALGAVDLLLLTSASPGSLVALSFIVLFWYVGRQLRFRGEYLRLLEERAAYLERRKSEEAELAVAEERSRIARELHDVVAHQVSLMTVQAGAAKTVAATDPAAALEAMNAVEQAGRHAMAEMRHLLDVLRARQSPSGVIPQPGCADVHRLVTEVSEAGTPVSLDTRGLLSGLAPRIDLAVYRIVQEALTNVIKHGGAGAHATVTLDAGTEGIEISVCDDGAGPVDRSTQGYGIAGMRERTQLLGGWLTAGGREGPGFRVRAFLPYVVPERQETHS